MAGLNDNYFLADDSMETPVNPVVTIDAFKDNQEGEETPELRNDIDLIAAATEELSIALRTTELFRHRLSAEGGMSQSAALEAHAYLPELINDLQPVGFYTKYPSKTLLNVALEAAEDKDQGIFKQFAEFLAKMMKRVVDWFKGFLQSDPVKELATEENTQLLKESKTIFQASSKTEETVNNKVDEVATTASKKMADGVSREQQIAEQRAEYKANKHAEKLNQLAKEIQNFGHSGNEGNPFLGVINSILGKVPHVKRILANPDQAAQALSNHNDTITTLNAFIVDIQRCIDKQDYPGLKVIIDDGKFVKLKQQAEQLAIVIVEFKASSADYTVTKYTEFLSAVNNPKFMDIIGTANTFTHTGLKECAATEKAMESIQQSIEQMASYKWSDREGEAKEFLETLKDFNKTVIVPTIQRIAFTASIVKQLLTLVNSIKTLPSTVDAIIAKQLKQRIVNRAKELGISEEELKGFV